MALSSARLCTRREVVQKSPRRGGGAVGREGDNAVRCWAFRRFECVCRVALCHRRIRHIVLYHYYKVIYIIMTCIAEQSDGRTNRQSEAAIATTKAAAVEKGTRRCCYVRVSRGGGDDCGCETGRPRIYYYTYICLSYIILYTKYAHVGIGFTDRLCRFIGLLAVWQRPTAHTHTHNTCIICYT